MRPWVVRTRKWINRVSVLLSIRFVLLLSRLLPYRFGVWTGGMFGCAAFFLLPKERNRAISHLRTVFSGKGEPWIRRTARQCFINLGKSMLEVMLITQPRLLATVTVEGTEHLQRALKQGRGVVFVTGHIGNWELMGHTVAALSSLSVVAAPIKPEAVNEIIVGLRARMGVRTILRGRPGASRELIRVFKENRILGILIDQDTDVEGAFVDFMGRPAWTPTAAASMAIKFSAPLMFGYIQRDRDNRHRVKIEGPVELVRTGNEEQDIKENTAVLTKKIEEAVMQNPEQWVWMHRRWRRQP